MAGVAPEEGKAYSEASAENIDVDALNAPNWLKSSLKLLDIDGDGLERHEIEETLHFAAEAKKRQKENSGEIDYSNFPPKVKEVLAMWDADGSGTVGVAELSAAADAQKRLEQEGRLMKKAIAFLVLVIIGLCVMNFVMGLLAVEAGKDNRPATGNEASATRRKLLVDFYAKQDRRRLGSAENAMEFLKGGADIETEYGETLVTPGALTAGVENPPKARAGAAVAKHSVVGSEDTFKFFKEVTPNDIQNLDSISGPGIQIAKVDKVEIEEHDEEIGGVTLHIYGGDTVLHVIKPPCKPKGDVFGDNYECEEQDPILEAGTKEGQVLLKKEDLDGADLVAQAKENFRNRRLSTGKNSPALTAPALVAPAREAGLIEIKKNKENVDKPKNANPTSAPPMTAFADSKGTYDHGAIMTYLEKSQGPDAKDTCDCACIFSMDKDHSGDLTSAEWKQKGTSFKSMNQAYLHTCPAVAQVASGNKKAAARRRRRRELSTVLTGDVKSARSRRLSADANTMDDDDYLEHAKEDILAKMPDMANEIPIEEAIDLLRATIPALEENCEDEANCKKIAKDIIGGGKQVFTERTFEEFYNIAKDAYKLKKHKMSPVMSAPTAGGAAVAPMEVSGSDADKAVAKKRRDNKGKWENFGGEQMLDKVKKSKDKGGKGTVKPEDAAGDVYMQGNMEFLNMVGEVRGDANSEFAQTKEGKALEQGIPVEMYANHQAKDGILGATCKPIAMLKDANNDGKISPEEHDTEPGRAIRAQTEPKDYESMMPALNVVGSGAPSTSRRLAESVAKDFLKKSAHKPRRAVRMMKKVLIDHPRKKRTVRKALAQNRRVLSLMKRKLGGENSHEYQLFRARRQLKAQEKIRLRRSLKAFNRKLISEETMERHLEEHDEVQEIANSKSATVDSLRRRLNSQEVVNMRRLAAQADNWVRKVTPHKAPKEAQHTFSSRVRRLQVRVGEDVPEARRKLSGTGPAAGQFPYDLGPIYAAGSSGNPMGSAEMASGSVDMYSHLPPTYGGYGSGSEYVDPVTAEFGSAFVSAMGGSSGSAAMMFADMMQDGEFFDPNMMGHDDHEDFDGGEWMNEEWVVDMATGMDSEQEDMFYHMMDELTDEEHDAHDAYMAIQEFNHCLVHSEHPNFQSGNPWDTGSYPPPGESGSGSMPPATDAYYGTGSHMGSAGMVENPDGTLVEPGPNPNYQFGASGSDGSYSVIPPGMYGAQGAPSGSAMPPIPTDHPYLYSSGSGSVRKLVSHGAASGSGSGPSSWMPEPYFPPQPPCPTDLTPADYEFAMTLTEYKVIEDLAAIGGATTKDHRAAMSNEDAGLGGNEYTGFEAHNVHGDQMGAYCEAKMSPFGRMCCYRRTLTEQVERRMRRLRRRMLKESDNRRLSAMDMDMSFLEDQRSELDVGRAMCEMQNLVGEEVRTFFEHDDQVIAEACSEAKEFGKEMADRFYRGINDIERRLQLDEDEVHEHRLRKLMSEALTEQEEDDGGCMITPLDAIRHTDRNMYDERMSDPTVKAGMMTGDMTAFAQPDVRREKVRAFMGATRQEGKMPDPTNMPAALATPAVGQSRRELGTKAKKGGNCHAVYDAIEPPKDMYTVPQAGRMVRKLEEEHKEQERMQRRMLGRGLASHGGAVATPASPLPTKVLAYIVDMEPVVQGVFPENVEVDSKTGKQAPVMKSAKGRAKAVTMPEFRQKFIQNKGEGAVQACMDMNEKSKSMPVPNPKSGDYDMGNAHNLLTYPNDDPEKIDLGVIEELAATGVVTTDNAGALKWNMNMDDIKETKAMRNKKQCHEAMNAATVKHFMATEGDDAGMPASDRRRRMMSMRSKIHKRVRQLRIENNDISQLLLADREIVIRNLKIEQERRRVLRERRRRLATPAEQKEFDDFHHQAWVKKSANFIVPNNAFNVQRRNLQGTDRQLSTGSTVAPYYRPTSAPMPDEDFERPHTFSPNSTHVCVVTGTGTAATSDCGPRVDVSRGPDALMAMYQGMDDPATEKAPRVAECNESGATDTNCVAGIRMDRVDQHREDAGLPQMRHAPPVCPNTNERLAARDAPRDPTARNTERDNNDECILQEDMERMNNAHTAETFPPRAHELDRVAREDPRLLRRTCSEDDLTERSEAAKFRREGDRAAPGRGRERPGMNREPEVTRRQLEDARDSPGLSADRRPAIERAIEVHREEFGDDADARMRSADVDAALDDEDTAHICRGETCPAAAVVRECMHRGMTREAADAQVKEVRRRSGSHSLKPRDVREIAKKRTRRPRETPGRKAREERKAKRASRGGKRRRTKANRQEKRKNAKRQSRKRNAKKMKDSRARRLLSAVRKLQDAPERRRLREQSEKAGELDYMHIAKEVGQKRSLYMMDSSYPSSYPQSDYTPLPDYYSSYMHPESDMGMYGYEDPNAYHPTYDVSDPYDLESMYTNEPMDAETFSGYHEEFSDYYSAMSDDYYSMEGLAQQNYYENSEAQDDYASYIADTVNYGYYPPSASYYNNEFYSNPYSESMEMMSSEMSTMSSCMSAMSTFASSASTTDAANMAAGNHALPSAELTVSASMATHMASAAMHVMMTPDPPIDAAEAICFEEVCQSNDMGMTFCSMQPLHGAVDEHGCWHEEDTDHNEPTPFEQAEHEMIESGMAPSCPPDGYMSAPVDFYGTTGNFADMGAAIPVRRRSLKEVSKMSQKGKDRLRRLHSMTEFVGKEAIHWPSVRKMSMMHKDDPKLRFLQAETMYATISAAEKATGNEQQMPCEDHTFLTTGAMPWEYPPSMMEHAMDMCMADGHKHNQEVAAANYDVAAMSEPSSTASIEERREVQDMQAAHVEMMNGADPVATAPLPAEEHGPLLAGMGMEDPRPMYMAPIDCGHYKESTLSHTMDTNNDGSVGAGDTVGHVSWHDQCVEVQQDQADATEIDDMMQHGTNEMAKAEILCDWQHTLLRKLYVHGEHVHPLVRSLANLPVDHYDELTGETIVHPRMLMYAQEYNSTFKAAFAQGHGVDPADATAPCKCGPTGDLVCRAQTATDLGTYDPGMANPEDGHDMMPPANMRNGRKTDFMNDLAALESSPEVSREDKQLAREVAKKFERARMDMASKMNKRGSASGNDMLNSMVCHPMVGTKLRDQIVKKVRSIGNRHHDMCANARDPCTMNAAQKAADADNDGSPDGETLAVCATRQIREAAPGGGALMRQEFDDLKKGRVTPKEMAQRHAPECSGDEKNPLKPREVKAKLKAMRTPITSAANNAATGRKDTCYDLAARAHQHEAHNMYVQESGSGAALAGSVTQYQSNAACTAADMTFIEMCGDKKEMNHAHAREDRRMRMLRRRQRQLKVSEIRRRQLKAEPSRKLSETEIQADKWYVNGVSTFVPAQRFAVSEASKKLNHMNKIFAKSRVLSRGRKAWKP